MSFMHDVVLGSVAGTWMRRLILTLTVIAVAGCVHSRPVTPVNVPPAEVVDAPNTGWTLIVYKTAWCEVCKKLSPAIVAVEHDKAFDDVETIDIDAHPEYGVNCCKEPGQAAVPCIVIHHNGIPVKRAWGLHARAEIEGWLIECKEAAAR